MSIELDLVALASTQQHLLHRADVHRLGITSRQWCRLVDVGVWLEVVPEVFCHVATPITWELRLWAAARWLGEDAALFGCTAAAWWGLDGFAPGLVDFVTPRGRRWLDPRVALHTTLKWDRRDLLMHRGLRCTSVTRTIIDLAGQRAPAHMLEAAIDSGMRMRLTSMPTLTRRISELSSTRLPGVVRLRELLLDSGGESFLERRFLRLLRENGLPRPRTQVVHRAKDRTVRRVDFEYPGVVIEVSGRLGHTSDGDRRRDARRRNELQCEGLKVIEFTTADVLDAPDYVLATITPYLPPSHATSRPPRVRQPATTTSVVRG